MKLQAEQCLTVTEADLLYLFAPLHSARFCVSGVRADGSQRRSLAAGQGVLLGSSEVSLQVEAGEIEVQHLGVINFAKLLAFIDMVEPGGSSPTADAAGVVMLDLAPEHAANRQALEYWFIRQVIKGEAEFTALTAFLRRLENYWLVKYLVSESSQQKNVGDLGDEYGLSYSHFRRVCKTVLGKSVKSELKVWRAARSLLDVVGGKESMTEVAIKHGYASSSHFSTEIKTLFGLSPRAMMELKH